MEAGKPDTPASDVLCSHSQFFHQADLNMALNRHIIKHTVSRQSMQGGTPTLYPDLIIKARVSRTTYPVSPKPLRLEKISHMLQLQKSRIHNNLLMILNPRIPVTKPTYVLVRHVLVPQRHLAKTSLGPVQVLTYRLTRLNSL